MAGWVFRAAPVGAAPQNRNPTEGCALDAEFVIWRGRGKCRLKPCNKEREEH